MFHEPGTIMDFQ